MRLFASAMLIAAISAIAAAQVQTNTAVPKLVRFNGTLKLTLGRPAPSPESVTLAVYRDEIGGAPLWQEVQNVDVDSYGGYSLLMGSTSNDGVPVDLFRSVEPRWLGVRVNRPGEVEQSRILMVSVPYALKASDAETLGGKPASAYMLASAANDPVASALTEPHSTPSTNAVKPRVNLGTPGFIGVFTNSTDLGNSVIQQANGVVGVGTVPGANAATVPSLDLRTNPFSQIGMAQTTDYLTFFASDTFGPAIYWNPTKDLRFGRGGPGLYNAFGFTEQMRIQSSTGNVGIGTPTPAAKLDVAGTINLSGNVLMKGFPVLRLSDTGNTGNVAVGLFANNSVTVGVNNTAVGSSALASNLNGFNNSAVGNGVLGANTAGNLNTGMGAHALATNSTGNANTAMGDSALFANLTGTSNTAIGISAMESNVSGSNNTANGGSALQNNVDGSSNTAIGQEVLFANSGGSFNTGLGYQVLKANVFGVFNTAAGSQALNGNTDGQSNVAIGAAALFANIHGNDNTAVGASALTNNVTGTDNIAIGSSAGVNVTGDGNIHIGNHGSSTDNAVIKIGTLGAHGKFFAAGVRGITTGAANALPVVIDSNGQLGTISSSRRFKEDIADMGGASRGLMDLRPVTFRYKQPFGDGTKPVQYGLIAEEVAEVYPDLVAHSADGQIESVKYQVLDSMLLNEVQRQQAEIHRLEKAIREQSQTFGERLARLEAALGSHSGASNDANVH